MSHVNKNEIDMKTISVEITPDRHNLIGASCLKNFLIENVAFADPKFAGEEASYTKKYPRVRRTLKTCFLCCLPRTDLGGTSVYVGSL